MMASNALSLIACWPSELLHPQFNQDFDFTSIVTYSTEASMSSRLFNRASLAVSWWLWDLCHFIKVRTRIFKWDTDEIFSVRYASNEHLGLLFVGSSMDCRFKVLGIFLWGLVLLLAHAIAFQIFYSILCVIAGLIIWWSWCIFFQAHTMTRALETAIPRGF